VALLKTNPPKIPLEERIHALRAEIDSEIDKRAEEIKKAMEGVPVQVIRNILTKSSGCQCAALLEIQASDLP
jgi:hypothetical protein